MKYEKFQNLCYCYGRSGHVDRDCEFRVTHRARFEQEGFLYGAWLRVDSGLLRNLGRVSPREDAIALDSGLIGNRDQLQPKENSTVVDSGLDD